MSRLGFFGNVAGDALGDDARREIKRGGDSGSAGHIRNDRLAGQEAGDGENARAESEVSFGAFAVKLGMVDADVGIGRGAVGQGLVLAAELSEVGIM